MMYLFENESKCVFHIKIIKKEKSFETFMLIPLEKRRQFRFQNKWHQYVQFWLSMSKINHFKKVESVKSQQSWLYSQFQ